MDFIIPLIPTHRNSGNPLYSLETNQYQNATNYVLGLHLRWKRPYMMVLKLRRDLGINNTNSYSGFYLQPEDDRARTQYPSAVPKMPGVANYHQSMNRTFEWVWENTLAYDKILRQYTINFVGGVSAQKNTWTGMGEVAAFHQMPLLEIFFSGSKLNTWIKYARHQLWEIDQNIYSLVFFRNLQD